MLSLKVSNQFEITYSKIFFFMPFLRTSLLWAVNLSHVLQQDLFTVFPTANVITNFRRRLKRWILFAGTIVRTSLEGCKDRLRHPCSHNGRNSNGNSPVDIPQTSHLPRQEDCPWIIIYIRFIRHDRFDHSMHNFRHRQSKFNKSPQLSKKSLP